MIKIEQLYVDLGPIPGNIYDPGTCTKSEPEVARGGFETVSNIQAPALNDSSSVISTNGTERTH